MNLGQIKARVGKELRFAPDVDEQRDDLRDTINEVYRELVVGESWKFRTRTFHFRAVPDFDVANADVTRIDEHTLRVVVPDGFTLADVYALARGGTVTIPWSTGTGFFDHVYQIDRATIVSGLGLGDSDLTDGAVVDLALEHNSFLDVPLPAEHTVQVKFPRYILAHDVDEVQRVRTEGSRRRGLLGLDQWTEAWWLGFEDPDRPGEPQAWLAASSRAWHDISPEGDKYQAMDNPAPGASFIATPSVVGGSTLPIGVPLDYAFTWFYQGRHSPLSPVATVTLTGGQNTVTLTALEIPSALAPGALGWSRVIWRRTNSAAWVQIATMTDSSVTTMADPGDEPASNPLSDRLAAIERGGSYDYIRLWPRPSTAEMVEVNYLGSVRRLELDEDVPQFPSHYHHALVHLTAARMGSRDEGAGFVKRQLGFAEQIIGRMKSKYLAENGRRMLRRGFYDEDQAPGLNFGIATMQSS